MIPPLYWNDQAFRVDLLDQTQLPVEEVWLEIETPAQMAEAIRLLRIRGAPAIGIAAAICSRSTSITASATSAGSPRTSAIHTASLYD